MHEEKSPMRVTRRVALTTTAVLAVALLGSGAGVRAQRINPSIQIDPLLRQVLATTALYQAVEAIVTFNQYPGMLDLARVRATGVQVLQFRSLPMVGVRGTPPQISNLFALAGVRSIYYNRRLSYFLN